jgi:hypothetical protein
MIEGGHGMLDVRWGQGRNDHSVHPSCQNGEVYDVMRL